MAVDKDGDRFQFHLMYIQLDALYIKYIMYGLETSKSDSALQNVDSLNVYKSQNIYPRFGNC